MKELIKCAIKEFIVNDLSELVEIDAHEVTFAHRIAVYLENKFRGYNVDLEYNRDKKDVKRIANGSAIRPDIIIHRRNKDDNLCVFEIKKNSIKSSEAKSDIEKLEKVIKKYKIGIFIGIQKDKIEICWIENENGNLILTQEVLQ